MKLVQWHPDNMIYIREDGAVLYCGSLEEASAVLGESLEPLPPGVRERILKEGEKQAVDVNGETHSLTTIDWPQGKKLMSAAMIKKAKAAQTKADDARAKKADAAEQNRLDEAARKPAFPEPPSKKPTNPAREDMKARCAKMLKRINDPKQIDKLDLREELQQAVGIVLDCINHLDE